jgi:4-hydroxybenzoate polyprenyltransferase
MNKYLALIFSSGLIIGLSMAGLAIITNILLSEPISLNSALVWFSMTSGLYAANRLLESDKDAAIDNAISSAVAANKSLLIVFSVGLTLLGLFLAFKESLELGFLVILTILYLVLYTTNLGKISFKKGGKRLKDYLGVKSLMVGIGLSFVVLYTGNCFHTNSLIALALLYFRTILNEAMNTIIYDMKDLAADSINGVNTLPIALGVKKTKYILHSLNGVVTILTLAGFVFNLFPTYCLGLLVSFPYFAFLIEYLVCEPYRKGHLYFQYILLDGAYLAIVPCVLLFARLSFI